jgi:hypothetical protein
MSKKNVMIMRNNGKNIETKLPLLGINIRFWLRLVGLAVVAGLVWTCGATISTVAGIYLGYKLLRLILRIFGLLVSLFVSAVFAVILIIIISLLIF